MRIWIFIIAAILLIHGCIGELPPTPPLLEPAVLQVNSLAWMVSTLSGSAAFSVTAASEHIGSLSPQLHWLYRSDWKCEENNIKIEILNNREGKM